MPFAVYDANAVRLLSAALSEVLKIVSKSSPAALTETEMAKLSKGIVASLMRAFDLGERDPSALTRAGLEAIAIPPPKRRAQG